MLKNKFAEGGRTMQWMMQQSVLVGLQRNRGEYIKKYNFKRNSDNKMYPGLLYLDQISSLQFKQISTSI